MSAFDDVRDGLANRTDVFKALSDPVRMDLFLRIATADEISCTEIVADADVSASTVSYHVKILKTAGLVAVRKQGRNYHYTARPAALIELADLLTGIATAGRSAPAA
ncbi:metalloregulator ArsR/SmtB family transcription factor [Saccharopolyspora cebuensis]|uniref:ArsR/SmtB family transcription factor n=1 Tax=Saccharopolyspora cebuensis TaxID=418759 RepID=A0ABV4CCI3_9PSEU